MGGLTQIAEREPRVIFGVLWTYWKDGYGAPASWRSNDGRLIVSKSDTGHTYRVSVDGEPLLRSNGRPCWYVSVTSAMEAAVKAITGDN